MGNKKTVPLIWNRAETPEELHSALSALAEEYPIAEAHRQDACATAERAGRPEKKDTGETPVLLRIKKTGEAGCLKVSRIAKEIKIEYGSLHAGLRGVAHALAGREADEETTFNTFGIMLDCSRNAVMTVTHLKKWMRRLSLLGYNVVMLYTENTYELPDEPYFGYMRGAYTAGEIRELDTYSKSLGIEMVACIQTLGHMEQTLKWGSYSGVMDTEHIMLVDEEKTYTLIEKMIKFWSEALGSRRIHVGMDEAHALGRGKFLDKHGFERQFDIFNRHLKKVCAICEQHGLKPMLWSDMYFKMSNPKYDYYDRDSKIPDDVKASIPKSVDLVYWDYCSKDEEFYSEWIRRHRELGGEPLMASGIWTWARFWYDHEQTVLTVVPCLNACRKEKVHEFLFTMWGDGGGYCEFDSSLAGLAWGADLAFGGSGTDKKVAPLFAAVCGGDYLTQLIPGGLQMKLGKDKPEVKASSMMWDDPLLGIAWAEYRAADPECWTLVLEKLRTMRKQLTPALADAAAGDIGYAWNICDLFIKKIEFRNALVKAYGKKDRAELLRLSQSDVPLILTAVDELQKSFRRQWLRRNKPFGMEVVQIRFGAMTVRYKETAQRIQELLEGKIDSIPELDVKIKNIGELVGFFDWLATGSLRV
jgi:hexosaminidase